MRFFFRSPQFKKAVATVLIIVALALTAGLIGGYMAPQAGLIGAITAPFQKIGNVISASLGEFTDNFKSAAALNSDKEKLQNEINSLREQLVDYEEAVTQNEFYEKYLGIKDLNPDFEFAAGNVLGFDPDDIFGGFTVGAGQLNSVSLYDPVITDAGVVGYISEVGLTTSKVMTILDPRLKCGAFDSRTGDAGALTGDTELAGKGYTRFYNLPRTCSVAVGDLVVTSGNGIFPDGLILGSINSIGSDPIYNSLYAEVTPTVNFKELKKVMIITSFAGKGNELINV